MQTNNKLTKEQVRQDWFEESLDWETSPATKTPEGFLTARAPLTSVGVFIYRNKDGSPRRELRLPEEVFSDESMRSLELKPLTLLHPDASSVNTSNIEELQVGNVGNDLSRDAYRIYGSLVVQKADAVSAVETGAARSLSCGYTCDIEWTSGTWMGMPYDCIQRNIRYNHLALVPVPRAGDGNEIRMDGLGTLESKNLEQLNQEERMNLKTIHLDGADFQAEPQVIAALDKAQTRVDSLEKELEQVRLDSKKAQDELTASKSAVEAERDTLKERLDACEKEIPSKISEAVKSRLDLLGKAQKAGVEVREDMADSEIKNSVILKKFPNANLEGKDESYIQSRFDCACELIAADAEAQSRKDAAETETKKTTTSQERLDEAKKSYNERLDSGWKDN